MIQSIIEENKRRIAPPLFRPLTGEGVAGPRFALTIAEGICEERHIYHTQHIPDAMRSEEIVQSLLTTHSIPATARALGDSPDNIAERFIRLRIRHDFPFWCAAFVKIKLKQGAGEGPFILNAPQRRLAEAFETQRRAGRPIRLILLKARQWGGSTLTQLYMAWLQLTQSVGLNSLIIAHQSVGSVEIRDMFDRMLQNYPAQLLLPIGEIPDKKMKKTEAVGRSGQIVRIPTRDCKVKLGSAERPNACRGGDYSLVHLSEVGIWRETEGKSPEDIVRSATSGVLLAPNTMIVMESTADGTGTFFHTEYTAAVSGESQFSAFFVAWYEIEQYRLALTDDERRALAERLYAGRESDTESPRTVSGRYLWSLWLRGASLEAIAWYRSERSKYSEQSQMASEYPSDDVEAFCHSGRRVFAREGVESLRAGCRTPLAIGEVQGEAISGELAIHDIHFAKDSFGGMEIWDFPDSAHSPRLGHRYLVAVDVGGRSVKSDWSVVAVLDRAPEGDPCNPPQIVAQWRGHCDMDILAWRAAAIAKYYDEALLVFESNTLDSREQPRITEGDQAPYLLQQIRDCYTNLYARASSPEEIRAGKPQRYGFHTNIRTKPMIISNLIKMVREGLYVERDEKCIEEMLTYEQLPGGGYAAIAGKHDDLVMTRAILLHIHTFEMPLPAPHIEEEPKIPIYYPHTPLSEADIF